MGTVNVSLAAPTCGHLRFTLSGDVVGAVSPHQDEMEGPMTEEERIAFIKGLLRLARIGRTRTQVVTLFRNGFTLTV